jgi:DNA-binding NtrC family response regulator
MGKGKVISKVLDCVEKYAEMNKPLLIEGATGTGKELIADYICRLSGRKMVAINCGAFNRELVNCELFGSVKGAFTDALDMKGKVEAAEGGILFLDEFNSLPFDIQVNLLRLIDNKTYTKVGDTVKHEANVRIIAAGNKSFAEMVRKGELREDLYERFVRTIHIPTLSERIEDMDYFFDRFIAEENKEQGKNVSISSKARKFLTDTDWPGNIRQLKNFIEVLVIEVEPDKSSKKLIIQVPLIRQCLTERRQSESDDIHGDDYNLQNARNKAEKKVIMQALDKTDGNIEEVIKLLGISRKTYFNLKKKLGI